jgi:hypothetical protein
MFFFVRFLVFCEHFFDHFRISVLLDYFFKESQIFKV